MLLAVVPVVDSYSTDVAYNLWPVVLLAGLVNFPGLILALGLDLLKWSGADWGSHPVIGWVVIFVVGSVFWVSIVWFILINRRRGPLDGS